MELKEYCKAPYSLQYLKYFQYVRVFNSEPFFTNVKKLDFLYTPCCGFKCVYLNSVYNFKKIIFFDISPAQIEFFKFLLKNWNGVEKISKLVEMFKKQFQTSIFKTDVKGLNTSFYDEKFNQLIEQYFVNEQDFSKYWNLLKNTEIEFKKIDITKNFKKLKLLNNSYFSLSNIFDFEILSCFNSPDQRKQNFKRCIAHLLKSKNSMYEFKFLTYNGLFETTEVNKIINKI